jgi:ferredoxin
MTTTPDIKVRIKSISLEAETVLSYDLRDIDGRVLPPFTAGAHIDLHLPNGQIRSYSLLNSQAERHRYVIAPGKTILQALLDGGIDVPYSCMEGICGSCEVRVLEGAPDHRDLVLSKEEHARNVSMMICCSGSKSDKLVLDL